MMANNFKLTSSAFQPGTPIPSEYTCEGSNVSPALSWSNLPEGTRSLALVVDDPDAPRKTFVHWVLFNLPPDRDGLLDGLSVKRHFEGSALKPVEGVNDFGKQGYGGPCPPPGDDAHHYSFRLYALDATLHLGAGATKQQLTQAMDGYILAEATLVGTYQRSR